MDNRAKIAVVLALVLVGAFSSMVIVDETEHVLIIQFGEYKRTVSKPGLTFKIPFAQKTVVIDSRIMASDAPPEEYLTADKKRVVADPITRWKVADPLEFYKTVSNASLARKRLDDIVLSELRKELGQLNMGEMVGKARGRMMAIVTDRVNESAKKYGITVVDVRIKHLDLPTEVQRSVFDRMVAERERLAKGYRAEGQEESDKITSATDRERLIILAEAEKLAAEMRGEGDAESTRIYADAYGEDVEFYAFLRNLEAYEKSIDKKATLVLSTGSKLFRYLTAPGKAGN
ncbi:MAG: protease modulator HflC [Polyangiaceae bacterium]